jgi:hypothetical protein
MVHILCAFLLIVILNTTSVAWIWQPNPWSAIWPIQSVGRWWIVRDWHRCLLVHFHLLPAQLKTNLIDCVFDMKQRYPCTFMVRCSGCADYYYLAFSLSYEHEWTMLGLDSCCSSGFIYFPPPLVLSLYQACYVFPKVMLFTVACQMYYYRKYTCIHAKS